MNTWHITTLSTLQILAYQINGITEEQYTFEQADSHYQEKNWETALEAYNSLVSDNPYKGEYWYRLGDIRYQLKNYDESARAYKKSLELGYNPQMAIYNIGRNFALQNNAEDAVKWLEQALKDGKYETSDGARIRQKLETDPDLDNIRTHSEFIKLLPPKIDDDISRIEGWRTDLTYMAERMELVHYNLFHSMSREEWNVAIENLYQKISDLTNHEVIIELMKIAAMVGDSHTWLIPPLPGFGGTKFQFDVIPAMFYEWSDGLFIRSAAPEYRNAVGARVLKVGDVPIELVLDKLKGLLNRNSNEMWVKEMGPLYLGFPAILHALKISRRSDPVEVVIEDDEGSQSTVTFKSEPVTQEILMALIGRGEPSGWIKAGDGEESSTPLWLKNPGNIYWFEYLPNFKLVYFQFDQVRDKPDEKFSDFCRRSFKFINENEVEALIIDIRSNSGGNGLLNQPLIHEIIKCEKINEKGKLFTIIGRGTVSAAMMLTVDLERHTRTIFVGEPTPASPNEISETNLITLPYSQLLVSASCIYWQNSLAWDRRIWIAPDIIAEMSSEDFKSNVDPAMNAILSYLGKSK